MCGGAKYSCNNSHTVFPRLEERFPTLDSQVRAFVAQHDQILETFEIIRSDLKSDLSLLGRANLHSKASFFKLTFDRHAASETQLFAEAVKRGQGGSEL